MTILRSFLLIVEVLCSLMLIGLILLQKSKGGGLGTAFGGGGEGSMFGSRTGNVLTKATIVLGLIFLLNTLVLGIMFSRSAVEQSALDRELMREAAEEQATEPANEESSPDATPGEDIVPVTDMGDKVTVEDAATAEDGGENQAEAPLADEEENP